MKPIDFFEGLGLHKDEVDPDKIAKEEDLRLMKDEVMAAGDRMGVVRLADPLRRTLGLTAMAEATDLIVSCAGFAEAEPDIAAAAGDPVEYWRVVRGAVLGYNGARDALAPVLMQARANEAVLQYAITEDLNRVEDTAAAMAEDPALSDADKDIVSWRMSALGQDDQRAAAASADRSARAGAWQAQSAAEVSRIETGFERLVSRAGLLHRLEQGEVPVGPPSSAPVPRTGRAGTTGQKGQKGQKGKSSRKKGA